MKRICSLVLFCSSTFAADYPQGNPTAQQVARLVAEAWSPPPRNVDIIYHSTFTVPPVDPSRRLSSLIEMELSRAKKRRSIDQSTEPGREVVGAVEAAGAVSRAEVEARAREVMARMEEQDRAPRHTRTRLRTDGVSTRVETSFPVRELAMTGVDTGVLFDGANVMDPYSGQNVVVNYDHLRRKMRIGEGPQIGFDKVWTFGSFPPVAKMLITLATMEPDPGTNPNPQILAAAVISTRRVEELVQGTNSRLQLKVRRIVMDGRPADEWALWGESKTHPGLVLTVLAADYRQVLNMRVIHHQNGRTVMEVHASHFRMGKDHVFPAVARYTRPIGREMTQMHTTEIVIESLSFPDTLPKEVFSLQAPAGYSVLDTRGRGGANTAGMLENIPVNATSRIIAFFLPGLFGILGLICGCRLLLRRMRRQAG